MHTLSDWIESIEKVIAMILIAAMTLVIAVAVVFRYFFNAPIFWASEASIFMMAWITFIGGSLGLKYKSQASVTFLVDRFSEKGKKDPRNYFLHYYFSFHGFTIIFKLSMGVFSVASKIDVYANSNVDSVSYLYPLD